MVGYETKCSSSVAYEAPSMCHPVMAAPSYGHWDAPSIGETLMYNLGRRGLQGSWIHIEYWSKHDGNHAATGYISNSVIPGTHCRIHNIAFSYLTMWSSTGASWQRIHSPSSFTLKDLNLIEFSRRHSGGISESMKQLLRIANISGVRKKVSCKLSTEDNERHVFYPKRLERIYNESVMCMPWTM